VVIPFTRAAAAGNPAGAVFCVEVSPAQLGGITKMFMYWKAQRMIVIKQPVPYDKRLNSKTGITEGILTFATEVVNYRRLF
jgi:hypothetical protein